MKKTALISACILLLLGIAYAIVAINHSQIALSCAIGANAANIVYGLYIVAIVLLFVLSVWKTVQVKPTYIATLVIELGAVFFLSQSILLAFSTYKTETEASGIMVEA